MEPESLGLVNLFFNLLVMLYLNVSQVTGSKKMYGFVGLILQVQEFFRSFILVTPKSSCVCI